MLGHQRIGGLHWILCKRCQRLGCERAVCTYVRKDWSILTSDDPADSELRLVLWIKLKDLAADRLQERSTFTSSIGQGLAYLRVSGSADFGAINLDLTIPDQIVSGSIG
jgi:hypothetical protein